MSVSPIEKIYDMIEREVNTLAGNQATGQLSKEDLQKLKDLTAILANLQKAPTPPSTARRMAESLSDDELLEKLK